MKWLAWKTNQSEAGGRGVLSQTIKALVDKKTTEGKPAGLLFQSVKADHKETECGK